jgi:hypothetical protein|tara:strand:+ start:7885 stop:8049 length:165 start_codon:yes stop_codon:yes gene_type:complete
MSEICLTKENDRQIMIVDNLWEAYENCRHPVIKQEWKNKIEAYKRKMKKSTTTD